MKSIRVLVANRPRLMRELVMATIADQPDIEIVGEVQEDQEEQEESAIKSAVDTTQPDFLIVALDRRDRLSVFCQSILQSHPQVKIIAIAPDRNTSVFYWASLHVQSNEIETSESGVLNALRDITQPTARLQ